MKKLASLILALAMVLTAVCAFAEAEKPVASPSVFGLTLISIEGGEGEVLVPDEIAVNEIARILNQVKEGTPISDLFGEEAAVALEGATDVLEAVWFQITKVDDGVDAVSVTLECATPFVANVQALVGIPQNDGSFRYLPLPTTVNGDGTVTFVLSGEALASAMEGPVMAVFVQL